MVTPHKWLSLQQEWEKLGIKEGDIIEKFILGSGSGGQKINKTSSCVYLKHIPSGYEIKCQKYRSREINRYLAKRGLVEYLKKELYGTKTTKEKQIEKIQKQKKRRNRKRERKIEQNDSSDLL
ncbi:MAG: peptide chain release factor family protein [Rhabdochlamydiaceae bacterium]